MPRSPGGHEWPDKAMFAALLLVLAGAIGAVFSLILLTGAVIGADVPVFLSDYPAWLSLLLSIVTVFLGVVSFRLQASSYAYAGVVAAIGSLGALGLVPVLALFSLGNLVLSWREGEETKHDERLVEAHQWPDKALAASLFLLVAGVIAILQGTAAFMGRFDPDVWPGPVRVAASYDILAGLFAIWASREIYHQRRAWLGWLGAGAAFLTFGFYVMGPALALTAMAFLALAQREEEFAPDPAPAPAVVRPPSRPKRKAQRARRPS